MAEYHEDFINVELTGGHVARTFMNHAIGGGDSKANRFGVRVYRDGAAESLSGSVFGEFIRADGATVAVTDGTISGNEAYITLPAACYAIEGNFTLAIKVSDGAGTTSTLRIIDGTVVRTSTDALVDPGELVDNIDELLAELAAATEGADNIANKKVNKPITNPDGTSGQLLRTNGDGTTTWTDAGNPTDAQTATAVSAWLTAHPEATTTVTDGSITRAKLDTKLKKIADWNVPVRFYFPDLSAGSYSQSCALVTIGGETLLMDAGKVEDWSIYQAWLDGLQTEGVFTNIDYIIISHYHLDHIGCLENILGRYPHAGCHAYIPPTIEGHAAEQAYLVQNYADVNSILSAAGVTAHVVTSETTVSTATDFADIELFNTTTADYLYYDTLYSGTDAIYNNYCMVALIRTGTMYSMFPGDIQHDAQKRIADARTLPRLFVYPQHHHGIQSDDYVPYLNAIDPQYIVVSTSQTRVLVSATSSSGFNYCNSQKGVTAYGEYRYACDGESGQILMGREIQKLGYGYFNMDVYVDNSYTGTVRDGSEDHPFVQINEAIANISRSYNLHYRIRVLGTATKYDFFWVRDYFEGVEIIGYKGTADVYPSVHGGYIAESDSVQITNVLFDGDGRDQFDYHPQLFIRASNVYLSGCTFDGANVAADYSANKIGIYIQETREVYMTGCTIQNFVNGVRAYRYGGITSAGTTFASISSSGYNLINMEVRLRAKDTLTGIGSGKWMLSQATGGATPIITDSGCITSAMAALISKQATSQPFYVNDSHPACVLAKSKIYDLFSGDEVTIS